MAEQRQEERKQICLVFERNIVYSLLFGQLNQQQNFIANRTLLHCSLFLGIRSHHVSEQVS